MGSGYARLPREQFDLMDDKLRDLCQGFIPKIPCAVLHKRRNHQSQGYVLNHHQSLQKSCLLQSSLQYLPICQ